MRQEISEQIIGIRFSYITLVFRKIAASGCFDSHPVAEFVFGIIIVAFYPYKSHIMLAIDIQEPSPEIRVFLFPESF